jgi:hypothetical protein
MAKLLSFAVTGPSWGAIPDRVEAVTALGPACVDHAGVEKAIAAGEHALPEGWRVGLKAIGVGLIVASIEIRLKDRVATRLSMRPHKISVRVVVVPGLRGWRPYEQQSASDDSAFHGMVLRPDGVASNLLGIRRADCTAGSSNEVDFFNGGEQPAAGMRTGRMSKAFRV